jgi:hypothetical protein
VSKSNSGGGGGVGLLGLVFVVFLTLKLTGHIDWSWWWVTAPLWGPLALTVAVGIGMILVVMLFAALEHWSQRK